MIDRSKIGIVMFNQPHTAQDDAENHPVATE